MSTPKTVKLQVQERAYLEAKFIPDATADKRVFYYIHEKTKYDWSFTKKEVIEVLATKDVSVTPSSDTRNRGLFRIGNRRKYYYSKIEYPEPEELELAIYRLLLFAYNGGSLTVQLRVVNNTNADLVKQPKGIQNSYAKQFPDVIPADDFVDITLVNEAHTDQIIQASVAYHNTYGELPINVLKSFNKFDSEITAPTQKELQSEVKIQENNFMVMMGVVQVAENLVLATWYNVQSFLYAARQQLNANQIESAGGDLPQILSYNKASQVFNRRFQLKPFAIVYCECHDDVVLAYNLAIANNLPVRVRAGGHDHEAESSGTNTVVIDVSRMNGVSVDSDTLIATIGPGNRFEKLTTDLAQNPDGTSELPVMIPHGTCATVGIAGFIFGGGWGPWTRDKGMCCEYLEEAKMVLGDGSTAIARANGSDSEKELLWALRGGGGFSYGIVTELKIKTFRLPEKLIKFEVEWNKYAFNGEDQPLLLTQDVPTKKVLQAWENVIHPKGLSAEQAAQNKQLIGTNLKISGINGPVKDDDFKPDTVIHNCLMYGYWKGEEADLETFIHESFDTLSPYELRIVGFGGVDHDEPYGANMMSSWDRESHYNVKQLLMNKPLMGTSEGAPLPPDNDQPAPHKITSRLVDADGLNDEGYNAFLRTLTSPLILEGNRELGLFTYTTLGAITGSFYDIDENRTANNCAFPYKDRLYTIQYQTWWNEALEKKVEGQDNFVYDRTNRAMDWMQQCRDAQIPKTGGAFISFKDSSIPTETYFAHNYDDLKQIKECHSKDPYNHFRTRKTII